MHVCSTTLRATARLSRRRHAAAFDAQSFLSVFLGAALHIAGRGSSSGSETGVTLYVHTGLAVPPCPCAHIVIRSPILLYTF